jgi:acyl-CoA dehydrogenase
MTDLATPSRLASSTAATVAAHEVARQLACLGPVGDRDDTLPPAAVEALRASGLLGLTIPVDHGGPGGDIADVSACARIIAGVDLSVAMVWAMHMQQVAVLARHASAGLRHRLLPRVAAGQVLVASATTEAGKGGHLLSAHAALRTTGSGVRVSRTSPVVTGGLVADGFLFTMRRHEQAAESDVVLVYADREQLSVTATGGWTAMGMRGTQSVPLQLDGIVPEDQVLDPPCGFRCLAVDTMIPVGHIAWASCWLGAAEQAYRDYVRFLRTPGATPAATTLGEVALHRLARVRQRLDMADAYLDRVVRDYCALLADHRPAGPGSFEEPGFNIEINNLKVIVSEEALAAVDELLGLGGLALGYVRDSPVPLERTYRDLRAAPLMYANDRLLEANGRLCLFDRDLRRVGVSPPSAAESGR